jgi:hypothetical protein
MIVRWHLAVVHEAINFGAVRLAALDVVEVVGEALEIEQERRGNL